MQFPNIVIIVDNGWAIWFAKDIFGQLIFAWIERKLMRSQIIVSELIYL